MSYVFFINTKLIMRATAMTDMKAMKFQITEGKNNQ